MTMQILRYGALALVSVCLVMIALVVSGLVPLNTVRGVMAKVPELVRVAPGEQLEVAKVDKPVSNPPSVKAEPAPDSAPKSENSNTSVDAAQIPVPEAKASEESPKTENTENTGKTKEGTNSDVGVAKSQTAPAFDILRVERDGSIVVAGTAIPNSIVELRTGTGKLVGSGRTGASGDFVIVPDEPLPSGDYSMSLVVLDDEGNPTISSETATVSVPEGENGDVLAMIAKEGEPSRIVAKPDTLKTDETDVKADSKPLKSEESKSKEPSADSGATVVSEEPNEEQQVAVVDPEEENLGQESEKADTGQGAEGQKDPLTRNDGSESGASQSRSETKPETGGNTLSNKSVSADGEEAASVATKNKTEIEADPVQEKRIPIDVRVEAVEIEQDQIFVAGAATNGSTVRIYIDDIFVGETKGTSDDRFLITRKFQLSRGQHSVRADSIDRATGKVVARAEVPLRHDPIDLSDETADENEVSESTDVANLEPAPKTAGTQTPSGSSTPVSNPAVSRDTPNDKIDSNSADSANQDGDGEINPGTKIARAEPESADNSIGKPEYDQSGNLENASKSEPGKNPATESARASVESEEQISTDESTDDPVESVPSKQALETISDIDEPKSTTIGGRVPRAETDVQKSAKVENVRTQTPAKPEIKPKSPFGQRNWRATPKQR